jgi:hypothetical protein
LPFVGLIVVTFTRAAAADQTNPHGCWNGSSYVLAWEEGRDGQSQQEILVQLHQSSGPPMGPPVGVTAGNSRRRLATIACGQQAAAVLWWIGEPSMTISPVPPLPVHVRRVGYDGSLGTDVVVGISAGTRLGGASDGQNFLLAWSSGPAIRVALLDGTGSIPTASVPVGEMAAQFPWVDVVFTGDAYLVLWPRGDIVMATFVDLLGHPIPRTAFVAIPAGSSDRVPAVILAEGRLALVYFVERVAGQGVTPRSLALKGMFLEPDGRMIGAIDLASVHNVSSPGLSWDGRAFLVSWDTADHPQGLRFDRDGHVLAGPTLWGPVGETPIAFTWVGGEGGNSLQAWSSLGAGSAGDGQRIEVRAVGPADPLASGDAGVPDASSATDVGGCSCALAEQRLDGRFRFGSLPWLAMAFAILVSYIMRWQS